MIPGRRRHVDRIVMGLAAAITIVTAVLLALNAQEAWNGAGWRIGVVIIALALAGPLHLRLPSGFDASPVAPSFALATVLAPMSELDDYWLRTALVVAGVVVGSLAGQLLSRAVGGERPDRAMVAARIVGATAAAALYRNIPWIDGRTPIELSLHWSQSAWRLALAMTMCGAVAVAIELGVLVLRTAPTGRIAAQAEVVAREIGPIWLAVLGIAVAISLGFAPLDLWSVPVMASPLLLMRTALRRQSAIAGVRHDTIEALSLLTEGTGHTPVGHGARVRDLSRMVGTQLMLTEPELRDLDRAALLHDLGQLGLSDPLPDGATSEAAPSDQAMIAADGAKVIRGFGGLERVAEIVEGQTVPFRNVREFGQDVPLECRILKVCNAYDDLTHGDPAHRPAALERILLGMGYEYDPDVVDLLSNLTAPAR